MGVDVRVNNQGLAELRCSPGVQAELERLMERAKSQARADAPVESGDYRDSLQVTVDVTKGARPRARARLGSDVDYAMQVEAAHGTLNRALDAIGGE
ncbi:MAG TPA: hypothetical protein VFH80_28310 [Solirubrobacteraceae bacterium]|nr:hypothetical protein [Solirubrobacteraceae bacterium]HET6869850.1 hypothetical protein [Solirubrobacteraceae bacterium]